MSREYHVTIAAHAGGVIIGSEGYGVAAHPVQYDEVHIMSLLMSRPTDGCQPRATA